LIVGIELSLFLYCSFFTQVARTLAVPRRVGNPLVRVFSTFPFSVFSVFSVLSIQGAFAIRYR